MGKSIAGYERSTAFPGCGAPYFYDYNNIVDNVVTPSTIKISNTGIAYFFKRWLLQRAIGVFKVTMPEKWEKSYALYTLFGWGYFSIINTDKYGVIPQGCGLWGYGVMYQPTHAVISNPLLRGILQPKIGEQCAIIRLTPDYRGIMDIINYFGNLMALAASGLHQNIFNTRLSYMFMGSDDRAARSFYSAFDKIASGEPAVATGESLYADDGTPLWGSFEQNISSNFVAPELCEIIRNTINDFDSYVGIPSNNVQKKERMVTDEVNANNVENQVLCELWEETIQEGVETAKRLFPEECSDLSITLRYKEVLSDALDDVDTGPSQLRPGTSGRVSSSRGN